MAGRTQKTRDTAMHTALPISTAKDRDLLDQRDGVAQIQETGYDDATCEMHHIAG